MLFFTTSCGVKYGFTGGSIPDGMKTVSVLYFENIASMVYPTLSQNFTEALKERIRNQSRLSQVNDNADATLRVLSRIIRLVPLLLRQERIVLH
ncbi:hypothetical protein L950_0218815 [Sphingobacterium sp. IITKGP-BTPF85]|nr:hypothetical protein L950_0218815 [Sphingobacterium sp. IITKGP-BTPF85]